MGEERGDPRHIHYGNWLWEGIIENGAIAHTMIPLCITKEIEGADFVQL